MFLGFHVDSQYFCPILIKFPLSSHMLKKAPTSNFTKIHQEEVMLIRVNRQIDGHDNVKCAFLNCGHAYRLKTGMFLHPS
jgi:hypothetical protein